MKKTHCAISSIAATAGMLISDIALGQCQLHSSRPVVFTDNTQTLCIEETSIAPSLSFYQAFPRLEPTSTDPAIAPEKKESYWEQWAYNLENMPIVTQSVNSNYFGLGFWLPKSLLEQEDEYVADEWFSNHGLLFSFGVGDKQSNETRLRFDYRWHDKYNVDWLMQIEVPFN